MLTMRDLLRRTSLRALGRFITDETMPVEELLEEDSDMTLDAAARRSADNLHLALRNGGAQTEARAMEALEEAQEAAWKIGFFAGIKAGARIVLSLTGEGEVVC